MKFNVTILALSLLAGCTTNRINNIDNISEAKLTAKAWVKAEPIIRQINVNKVIIVAPGSPWEEESKRLMLSSIKKYPNLSIIEINTLETLKHSLLSNDNDIIWAVRGGYGTAKTVEQLYKDQNFMLQMQQKKRYPWFIGYSDITALHLFLAQEFGWKTIHGPVFNEISDNTKNRDENFQLLDEVYCTKIYHNDVTISFLESLFKPLNHAAHNTDKVAGKLTGGNLSIIQTSLGTKFQIQTKDKILFLEDTNEKAYKIDRILHHLKMAKIFDSPKAIIFGDFGSDDKDINKVLKDFAQALKIPVYSTKIFGHGVCNYPMVYNADVEIQKKTNSINLIQRFLKDSE